MVAVAVGNAVVTPGDLVRHFVMMSDATPRDELEAHWPPFGIRIETPRLTMRLGRDHDFAAVLALIDDGIHGPDEMPFNFPWTDGPADVRSQRALRHWWAARDKVAPTAWTLDFFVFVDGQPIGVQGVFANEFPTVREATTGSWLGQRHQGKGYGIEMRSAILHFGFETLGASAMLSAAFVSNPASNRVSTKLGYEPNGTETKAPRGEPVSAQRFRMTRERWLEVRRPLDVQVSGFDPCRPMLEL
jgi:RimJ/RimL family protein N-acetyltransferase